MKISFPLLLSLLANFISSSSVFERCTEGDLKYKVDPVAAGHLIKHGEDALQSYIQNREVAKVFDYYKRIIRISKNAQVDLPASLMTKLQSFVENVMIRPASNSVNQLKYLNQMKKRSPKDRTERLESLLGVLSAKSDEICLAFSELGEIAAILANDTAKSNIEKVRKELRKFATDRILDSKNFCEEFDDIVEKVTMCLQKDNIGTNEPLVDVIQEDSQVSSGRNERKDFISDEKDQIMGGEHDSPDLLNFTAGKNDCLTTNQLKETISSLIDSNNVEAKLDKINEGLELLCDPSNPDRQELCSQYREQIISKASTLFSTLLSQKILQVSEHFSNASFTHMSFNEYRNESSGVVALINDIVSSLKQIRSINTSLSQIGLYVDIEAYMDQLLQLLVKFSNEFMTYYLSTLLDPQEVYTSCVTENMISELILFVFDYFKNDSSCLLPLKKLIDLATLDSDPEWVNIKMAFHIPEMFREISFSKVKQLQLLHKRIEIEISHIKEQLEVIRESPESYAKLDRKYLNEELDSIFNVFMSSVSFASTMLDELMQQCAEDNSDQFEDVEIRDKLIENLKLYVAGKRLIKADIEALKERIRTGKKEDKPAEPVVNGQPQNQEDADTQLAILLSLNQTNNMFLDGDNYYFYY